MGLRERVAAFLNPPTAAASIPAPAPPSALAARATAEAPKKNEYSSAPVMGGRQSQPANYNPFGLTGWQFLPQRQYEQIDITELDVKAFTANQLFALLPDLSPEMGKAVWSFLRVAGTNIHWQALTPRGDEDDRLQAELDDVILRLNPQFGGIDAIITQLELSAYLQGSVALDVAPTEDLRDVDDIFPVSPDTILFQRDADQGLVPFQRQQIWHAGGAMPYRQMNEDTFFFIPVDAYIDDPYGRSPIAPVLNVVFSWAQVLRDLAKVVHHQGWPKIDISLVWELMEPTVPEGIRQDDAKKHAWLTDRMGDVARAYAAMRPEDAFIHLDYVKATSDSVSAGSRMFDVQAITQIFRAEMIEALKSLPIFHGGGMAEGDTETYGSLEFEIYVHSVQMLRDVVRECMERALTVALQLRGVDAIVRGEWEGVRTTQRLADAESEAKEIENEVNKRDQGWITQDDASNAITGSEAVAPAPTPSPSPMAPPVPAPQDLPPGDDPADRIYARGMEAAYVAAAMAAQQRASEGKPVLMHTMPGRDRVGRVRVRR